MKNKKQIIALISFLVAITVIVSGLYFSGFLKQDKLTDEEKHEEFVLDDRISPLTNQALYCEILRIRHRGSLEKLLKPSLSWRVKPSFYFDAKVDDLEFSSGTQGGGVASGGTFTDPFKTWDTITNPIRFTYDSKEEQETSRVTISLYEQKTTGVLIFKKTENIKKDEFTVIYDYRTGRWSGKDDSFKDKDGYGHFVGKTFEIWFNLYQTDYDHDGIPFWTEVNILGTDPIVDDSKLDPDMDGIPTSWEWKWDYDPMDWDNHVYLDPDIDGIENIEEYQMRKWVEDPYHQDVYIEVDGMASGNFLHPQHIFHKIAQQALIERFCQHNINIYIDDGWPTNLLNGGGEILPYVYLVSQSSGKYLSYYENHFSAERRGIFRYVFFANRAGFCIPSMFNSYDTIGVGTWLKNMVTIKKSYIPRTNRIMEASYTMHELGHSFGIIREVVEGCDNFSYNAGKAAANEYKETWGQYYSVMNYYHISDKTLLDYSDGIGGSYDFDDWGNLFLPTFQKELYQIEDAGDDLSTEEGLEHAAVEFIERSGWRFDKNLTNQFTKDMVGFSPIAPIDVDWLVFVKTDKVHQSGSKNIRIYSIPDVAVDHYPVLTYEGKIDLDGNIELYSHENILEEFQ
ncbi:MAG: hypothetical protein JSW62_00265 [Thermoplasmatales archaeon]|nr:MAG: hypothetical protein JSW62_00265 [Thermoplasmatales archaeon]